MSLAPASIRGAFLKARLAVNGIQWAARSFGTLTAGALGLLSSIGASLNVRSGDWEPNYQLRRATGTPMSCDLWPVCGELLRGIQPRSAAVAKNTSACESSVSS